MPIWRLSNQFEQNYNILKVINYPQQKTNGYYMLKVTEQWHKPFLFYGQADKCPERVQIKSRGIHTYTYL